MSSREEVFQFGLACSEDKKDMFSTLAEGFNQAGYRLEDGRLLRLRVHFYDSETVIRVALGKDFPLICPESTLDLYDLETQWEKHYSDMRSAVAASHTFAMTPVVFLIHPQMAKMLGYPERQIGWHTLHEIPEATHLSHELGVMRAHGQTGHGKLITVAQFIAGMRREREHEKVHDEEVLSFVRSLEKSTREYGLTDQDVIERSLRRDNRWLAGLIVAQERNVLRALANMPDLEAVMVYPQEGTIWADHPLALMESWAASDYQVAFDRLSQHLSSPDTDRTIMRAGFHSAQSKDLGSVQEVQRFRQTQPPSIQRLNLVSYGAPPMVLPGIKVARAIGEQWENVEKPADVCFVIDVSGSMDESDKLPKVKSGIYKFLDRFKSPESKVSLITFRNWVEREVPLDFLSTNRRDVENVVSGLSAGGRTALLDAVSMAVNELGNLGDSSHIQAIIALTDGEENSSSTDLSTILLELRAHRHLVFYGIAYGNDADQQPLQKMANATNGLAVDSSPSGIEQLFQQLARRV